MKQIDNIFSSGDHIKDIICYWFPEMISTTLLLSLPPIIDSYIVASLKSTMTYGALGMSNNFLHFLIKLAEAIPIASIAIIGRYNGAQQYQSCGKTLGDTFWTTTLIGATISSLIFFNSANIFRWLGVPQEMVTIGVPFLQLKSISIFLIFVSLGFFAFLRGIKNTKVPMIIYSLSIAIFIVFDWILVLGNLGFNKMGLIGSSIASIIQYSFMIIASSYYIISKDEYKKYFSTIFFKKFSLKRSLKILNLSWPIMFDKSSLAFSYVWLSKTIAPMGKYAIATFDVVKNLERFALVPALGFGIVITFLVSNRLGAKDNKGAKANIKKVILIAFIMTLVPVLTLCLFSKNLVKLFDQTGEFTNLASTSLIFISFLVFFDCFQLILAAALRGAGDVKTVMAARICFFGLFFAPVVYLLSHLKIENQTVKFVLLYGSFYLTIGLVSLVFIKRVRTTKWQNKQV